MLLLLNAVPNFYWISQHSEPTCIREFIRVKRVRRCVHARQYIGFLKQILFFSYFHWISLNKYLFFPYFHLVSMLLINVWPCDLLSWCFYSGMGESEDRGGDGYCSWIFAEKFRFIFKVCVRTDRGRREVSQMWIGVDKRKRGIKESLKMCGHSLWMVSC